MCGKSFKKVEHIVFKIIAFEVKKRPFFTPYKTRSTNFESSWLKTISLYKVEAFDFVLRNWVENPLKIIKIPKNLYFHSLKGHQVGGSM
jgi:hypothetical protein